MNQPVGRSLLHQLNTLSSAEDFFEFLNLDYDEKILKTSRLHIMKRMGDYLAHEDFSTKHDDEIFILVRQYLERAYDDFVNSSPQEEKVFKVFDPKMRAGGFVGLDALETPDGQPDPEPQPRARGESCCG